MVACAGGFKPVYAGRPLWIEFDPVVSTAPGDAVVATIADDVVDSSAADQVVVEGRTHDRRSDEGGAEHAEPDPVAPDVRAGCGAAHPAIANWAGEIDDHAR